MSVTSSDTSKRETTQQTADSVPLDGVIGESVETPQFDLKVVDVFVTDHYRYIINPPNFEINGFSEAGKFVVVTYSLTNTSSEPWSNPGLLTPGQYDRLFVEAGPKYEVYEETDQVVHPLTGGLLGQRELAPRQMLLGQSIFDVPADVQPGTVALRYPPDDDSPNTETLKVDLTEEDPQGPGSEEILALQYEYHNMTAYAQAYGLFAQESKERVSEQRYISELRQNGSGAYTEYSFPSTDVQGEHATIELVYTATTQDGETRNKVTQEMVLEDNGWRVVMRDKQYEMFFSRGNTASPN